MLRQFQNWNGISTLQYIQARTDEQERVHHERELKITKDDLKHKHLNYRDPLSYYKRLDDQNRKHEMKAGSTRMRRRILKNQR